MDVNICYIIYLSKHYPCKIVYFTFCTLSKKELVVISASFFVFLVLVQKFHEIYLVTVSERTSILKNAISRSKDFY